MFFRPNFDAEVAVVRRGVAACVQLARLVRYMRHVRPSRRPGLRFGRA